MPRTRTFIDSNVLISAFRGEADIAQNALDVLDDASRDFVTSDFVHLELLPKPICYGINDERDFYEAFFSKAKRTIRSSRTLVEEAKNEAAQAGLSAVDALHVAAAKRANCDELVTAEKPTKPLFNVNGLAVITIRPSTT